MHVFALERCFVTAEGETTARERCGAWSIPNYVRQRASLRPDGDRVDRSAIGMLVDLQCRPVELQDTGRPAPVLADLLDAWVCSGLPVDAMQSHITPDYPYDPTAPNCK